MRLLDAEAMEDLVIGSTILGAGGGGDPYVGKLLALETVENGKPLPSHAS